MASTDRRRGLLGSGIWPSGRSSGGWTPGRRSGRLDRYDRSGAGRHREAGADRARRPTGVASRNDRHRLEGGAGSGPGGNRGDASPVEIKADPDRDRGRGRGPLGRGRSPPDDRSRLAWSERVDPSPAARPAGRRRHPARGRCRRRRPRCHGRLWSQPVARVGFRRVYRTRAAPRRGAGADDALRADPPGREVPRKSSRALRSPRSVDLQQRPAAGPADKAALFAMEVPSASGRWDPDRRYPWLIHRLTYRRTNHHNIHVRGYKEEGTITTAFDMTVLNDLDRFHLVMDAIDR